MRRAMSWVTWLPKSRIRILSRWAKEISGAAREWPAYWACRAGGARLAGLNSPAAAGLAAGEAGDHQQQHRGADRDGGRLLARHEIEHHRQDDQEIGAHHRPARPAHRAPAPAEMLLGTEPGLHQGTAILSPQASTSVPMRDQP